ncbi:MAG: hypothetical protein KF724_11635 [Phycisphaeraceae bacterium]|nr:hypothetical protein [Phycisphaeraceae bacterium]
MASITTRSNGSRFISFRSASGAYRHITLGQVPKRYADALKVRVEDLVTATFVRHAPSDETARWLAGIDDRLYDKLVAVELAAPRRGTTLEEQVNRYIAEREDQRKIGSLKKLRQTGIKLFAFFVRRQRSGRSRRRMRPRGGGGSRSSTSPRRRSARTAAM